MTYGLATKSLLASDKALATGFVGLFSGSVTYLAVALQGTAPTAGPGHISALVSAAQDHAILGGNEGLRRVTVGAVVPGFGQIVGIEQRDGRWTVIFASGKVLTTAQTAGPR